MSDKRLFPALDAMVRKQLEPLTDAAARLIKVRYGTRGGPPPGQGLTVDQIVAAVLANERPDGSWPTQEAVAEVLNVSPRRVRQVACSWTFILALADEERADRV
jgi:hypothetical protein